jgi:hypothetical protein
MKRVIIAGVVGGFIAFVWGGVSWSVLPYQTGKYKNIPQEDSIAAILKRVLPAEGVYHFPGYPEGEATKESEAAFMQKIEQGPYVPLLVYKRSGAESVGAAYTRAMLLDVVAGIVFALALTMLVPTGALRTTIAAGSTIIAFTVLTTHGADMSWGLLPSEYSIAMAADLVIGWLLATIVIALISRGRTRVTVNTQARV